MIQFINVGKRYSDGHEALKNVSFELARGEMAFLTGHSGAGKSTLLKLIMLMERASKGQITVGNQNLARIPPRQVPYYRRHAGVVFQDHKLLFDRTIFDNVAIAMEVAGTPPKEIAKRVRAALDKVGLLSKEKLTPIQLSGGEQQRVGIARAVVNKPPILLADEPTGNLDPELSAEIMKLFSDFNQVGVTVLIATHDLELISRLPYRVIELDHGHIRNEEAFVNG
ncbi:MAG: cell division ATP-binding protein FtsE [Oleiphilaceae bacterium]|nr:cell division ATP-binding protein FtsE [Oleiphilaceae bacterium]